MVVLDVIQVAVEQLVFVMGGLAEVAAAVSSVAHFLRAGAVRGSVDAKFLDDFGQDHMGQVAASGLAAQVGAGDFRTLDGLGNGSGRTAADSVASRA